ncbi:MAG: preprotein translocase subunit SecY [Firmicutes bacterium]|nr:preprotein translocase subunit SecY [Bacillota bacterium]
MGIIQTFKQAWKIPEMRKKLLFTLMILVIFRLGSNVPVPGINRAMLKAMFNSSNAGLFGLFDLFSGGAFGNFTIFALGISPYITASIILQLLTVAFPALEELSKQGEEGRKKMERITRYITLGLAALQGFGYTFGLFKDYLTYNDILSKIVIVMILVAGACLTMWLGEKINEHGVGNGISMLIFAGIVSRIPTGITNTFKGLKEAGWAFLATKTVAEDGTVTRTIGILTVLLFVLFALAVIVGIIIITEGTRKVPVQYAKRVVGRKMYGGQSTHIPLKVNQAGVIPIIFASSLLQVPATIAYMVPNSGYAKFIDKYFSTNGNPGFWIYFVFEIILIIAFTYFYGTISVNPPEIADNLKNNGGFIPGIRPGKETAKYLSKICAKLTIVSAIFLALVAAMPTLLQHWTALAIGFGGTSLIIAVGCALDTERAVETQLQMRNYSGFLK